MLALSVSELGLAASCTPFPLTSEGPLGAITLFAGACEEPVPLAPPPEGEGDGEGEEGACGASVWKGLSPIP